MTWSRAKNTCTYLWWKNIKNITIFSGDLWPDRGPSTTSWTHSARSRSLLPSNIQVLLTLLRIMLILLVMLLRMILMFLVMLLRIMLILLVMLLRIILILLLIRNMSVTTWSQHPVIFYQTWVFAILNQIKPDQSWFLRFWVWIWKLDLTFSPNVTAKIDGVVEKYWFHNQEYPGIMNGQWHISGV